MRTMVFLLGCDAGRSGVMFYCAMPARGQLGRAQSVGWVLSLRARAASRRPPSTRSKKGCCCAALEVLQGLIPSRPLEACS